MKREKISLFILVVEIALIAFLHSAKNNQTVADKQLVNREAGASTYQLKQMYP